eukprot:SAG11_NODE_1212_length_5506_cov_3.818384_7_plen_86_part_00
MFRGATGKSAHGSLKSVDEGAEAGSADAAALGSPARGRQPEREAEVRAPTRRGGGGGGGGAPPLSPPRGMHLQPCESTPAHERRG